MRTAYMEKAKPVPCDYRTSRNAAQRTRLFKLARREESFAACRQLHTCGVTARVRTPSRCSIAQFFIHRGDAIRVGCSLAGRYEGALRLTYSTCYIRLALCHIDTPLLCSILGCLGVKVRTKNSLYLHLSLQCVGSIHKQRWMNGWLSLGPTARTSVDNTVDK